MATQAYRDWVAAGEPWRNCKPAAEIKAAIVAKLGSGIAIHLGTLGKRDTHLMVDFPQDHAPFSFTEWPVKVSEYVVNALDIMHQPALGLHCDEIFDYYLVEAKAGRQPWLKYIIWQAKLYDVRNDWRAQDNSGHFDHIHMSFRTDWINKGIGGWSPLPPEDDMTPDQATQLKDAHFVLSKAVPNPNGDGRVPLHVWADWMTAAVKDLRERPSTAINYDELAKAIVRALLDK